MSGICLLLLKKTVFSYKCSYDWRNVQTRLSLLYFATTVVRKSWNQEYVTLETN